MNRLLAVCASAALTLGGCANTTQNLQIATASTVGQNLAPENVVVSNVDRGITTVKWQAATPVGQYACSADDLVRRPYCVKK